MSILEYRKNVQLGVAPFLDKKMCEMLSNFDHRNLVKVLSYNFPDVEGESITFNLEYCRLGSLREVLDGRKVDVDFVNRLIKDVLAGLVYLHKLGFVHGDIKLSNILLGRDRNGELTFKLGDLDTVRPCPSEFSTKGGFYTPEIVAPECYLTDKMDDRADVWSFVVLLFKVFTGEYPFGHRGKFNFDEIRDFIVNRIYQLTH